MVPHVNPQKHRMDVHPNTLPILLMNYTQAKHVLGSLSKQKNKNQSAAQARLLTLARHTKITYTTSVLS